MVRVQWSLGTVVIRSGEGTVVIRSGEGNVIDFQMRTSPGLDRKQTTELIMLQCLIG